MLIVTISLPLLLLTLCSTVDIVLQTKYGKLRGTRNEQFGQYVDAYKGIPYALPPTGARRFEAPSPAVHWSGTRDATNFKSTCPQPATTYNEDCLYLNVYTWKAKGHTTPSLPVMVFIHGGAFITGTSALYDGSALALHSTVIVTLNYRLGALGFLSTEDAAAPGNYGMLDQVLALKWVRDNIADYGGDPNRVTIFGESAGGASVSLHLLSPLSKGLFHGAIMESGVSLSEWAVGLNTDHPSPLDQAKFVGTRLGCKQTNTTQLMDCLKKVDVKNLVSVQDKNTIPPGRLIWSPVVETVTGFLSEHPKTLIYKGMLMDVPTIRGVNHDEEAFFLTQEPGIAHGISLTDVKHLIHKFVQDRYSTNKIAAETAIVDFYLKDANPADRADIRTRYIKFMTEVDFYIPALTEAESQASKGGSPVYMYEFDYRSPKAVTPAWEGVPHTAELYYLFGAPLLGGPHWTEHDKTVSSRLMGYFTNFAKNGNPSYNGVTWDAFTINKKSYLAIGSSSIMKTGARTAEEKLWLETLPKLVNTRNPILG